MARFERKPHGPRIVKTGSNATFEVGRRGFPGMTSPEVQAIANANEAALADAVNLATQSAADAQTAMAAQFMTQDEGVSALIGTAAGPLTQAAFDDYSAGLVGDTGTGTRAALDAAFTRQRPDVVDIRTLAPTVDLSGVADARTALQAALDALPPGSRLIIPPGSTLNLSSGSVTPKAIHLDARGATVVANGTTAAFTMGSAASGSTVTGLRLAGNSPTTYRAAHRAFDITGTAASPVTGLRFDDVTVDGFGSGGWYCQHVRDFVARDPKVTNCGYHGFMMLSAIGVNLHNPVIRGLQGILANGYRQSYPAAFSRDKTVASLTTAPQSQDCTVWGGHISQTGWEGVDTHGGIGIRVIGTTILGCHNGVAFVPGTDPSNVDIYAPRDCLVSGVTVDSGVSDGSKGSGIKLVGAGGVGARVMAATGVISGVRVIGHGSGQTTTGGDGDTGNMAGGIELYQTQGVKVSDFDIIEPSPFGIGLRYDNTALQIGQGTVRDPWSNKFSIPAAVALRSNGNDVTLGAVRLLRGSKTATTVADSGVYVATNTGTNLVCAGGHDFTPAGTAFRGGSTTAKASFPGVNPSARQVLASTASAADLVAYLKSIGLAL